MEELRYCVYCHTTPDGKKYVGVTKNNPIDRWNNGRGYIKNYLFYPAIQKYGWDNIKHEILYSNLTSKEANDIEYKLTIEWNLLDPNVGYNLREGGNGAFSQLALKHMSESQKGNKNCVGHILSQETRDKISNSLKEYYKEHGGTFTGKHHLEETKEKIRERNRINSPNSKPVIQYTLEGEFIQEYISISDAARKCNLDNSGIGKCCRGQHQTCGGYKWEYKT